MTVLLYKNFGFRILFFFNLKKICFNWRIIALQYCDGFCHTSTWICHRYTCVIPPIILPPPSPPCPSGLSQSTNFGCSASCIKLALVVYFTYVYHSFLTSHINVYVSFSLACPHIFFINKFSWSFPSILEKNFCSGHRQFAGGIQHSFPKRIFSIYPLIVPWTINCNTELWLKNVC